MINIFDVSEASNQLFRNFTDREIRVDIKREDLLHPVVSGNKLRKLKYNLDYTVKNQLETIVTYGGAYSNHIAATAAACHILGLKSIGIIRGEELGVDLHKTLIENTTLKSAVENGMQLEFITREEYKEKNSKSFKQLIINKYGPCFIIPEGGTNLLAIQGTSEILTDEDKVNYDIICVAAGTGGTAAGIIESSVAHQKVLVFSALKGDFLQTEIEKYTDRRNFTLFPENAFGGYAKSNDELIEYMNARFRESGIPLDPIYTGKMMYRVEELISKGFFPAKTRILAIHTGGLQGVAGFNRRLEKKGRLQLQYEDHI